MSEKVIAVADQRYRASAPLIPARLDRAERRAASTRLQRPLRDLRISVTDRCNFRCSYCMPKEVFDQRLQLPAAVVAADASRRSPASRALFVAHGVRKIRLTGGEPLLRRDLERLVGDAGRAAHAPTASRSTSR